MFCKPFTPQFGLKLCQCLPWIPPPVPPGRKPWEPKVIWRVLLQKSQVFCYQYNLLTSTLITNTLVSFPFMEQAQLVLKSKGGLIPPLGCDLLCCRSRGLWLGAAESVSGNTWTGTYMYFCSTDLLLGSELVLEFGWSTVVSLIVLSSFTFSSYAILFSYICSIICILVLFKLPPASILTMKKRVPI